jgi:hypothetical protein
MITAAMAEKLEAQGYQLSGKKEKVKRLEMQDAPAGSGEQGEGNRRSEG